MEITSENVKTLAMDHHGLVAAVCRDIGIAEKIDHRLGKKDPRRIVSAGAAVVGMILNGLGFTNRRLYLTPQFFESKPIERLLQKGIEAKHLDDHALCLMIYNVAQYRLRQALKMENETLPNQLKKPVQNPTMRWIFQIMEGVGVVRIFKNNVLAPVKELVTNLNELRKKIIRFFGSTACHIYGIS